MSKPPKINFPPNGLTHTLLRDYYKNLDEIPKNVLDLNILIKKEGENHAPYSIIIPYCLPGFLLN